MDWTPIVLNNKRSIPLTYFPQQYSLYSQHKCIVIISMARFSYIFCCQFLVSTSLPYFLSKTQPNSLLQAVSSLPYCLRIPQANSSRSFEISIKKPSSRTTHHAGRLSIPLAAYQKNPHADGELPPESGPPPRPSSTRSRLSTTATISNV